MNFKGELFSTIASMVGIAVIKLVSSVVLTRLLYPEAYGLVAAVASTAFVIEMLSDLGVVGFMIRHPQGESLQFVHTMWTLRFIRGLLGFLVLFAAAPYVAEIYGVPLLTEALRIFSVVFLVSSADSMSFVMALRFRRIDIVNRAELLSVLGSTAFVIVFSYFFRDHWGMIYGMVLHKVLMLAQGYRYYIELRPKFRLDPLAVREILRFTKIVMPSSIITMCLSQFDRIVLLKLFNLELLGYYGLATNLIAPVDSVTYKVSGSVLFPRCAEIFRQDPASYRNRYYRENFKLFLIIMFLPAAVGGASELIVEVLFDARYAIAGSILMVCSIRAMLLALALPAENSLMASGHLNALLVGQIIRVSWLTTIGLLGYTVAGFKGFLFCVMLDLVPAWVYFLYKQHRAGIIFVRYEIFKVIYIAMIFISFYLISSSLSGFGVAFRNFLKQMFS